MNPSKLSALLLVLMMALAACSAKESGEESVGATESRLQQDEPTPSSAEPRSAAGAASIAELPALVDAVVAEAGDLPRAEFDPAALAKLLGKDPRAHFEWVRDRTWWAPYRGLLRGSQGVLLDRLGSNLDRAVLLGDLLRHAGHTVRLAHAELPEAQARGLLGKVKPIPELRRQAPATRPPSAGRMRLIEAAMPGYAASQQQWSAVAQRREDEARKLVRSNVDQLQAVIRELASDAQSDDRTALAALRNHWWIERKDGDRWVAMDILLADARPGDAVATATSVFEWKLDASSPPVPLTEWHAVHVRVIVERYEGGATKETSVLEKTLQPASVLDRPISLRHFPKQWPETVPGPGVDPNALGSAAINVREWVPVLQVGTELTTQSGFTDGGDLVEDPLNPKSDIAGVGAGFMSGFGEALGGGETAASSITAEWIEYEIRVPGEPAQRIRRPVFDLLGPVLRSTGAEDFDANTNDRLITRSEALLSQTEILLQPCEITVEFVSHLSSASIVANQAALKELAGQRDAAKLREMASELFTKMHIWGPLPDVARWRSALSDRPIRWFVNRPNVLSFRVSPPVVNADRAVAQEVVDIASNSIGVRASAGSDSFSIRARQGVADTVAELVAIRKELRGAENTASIMSMVKAENAGALVRPHDLEAIQELGWPEEAAARLGANIEAGFAAFALRQPVDLDGQARAGWWRIDTMTGETIGVMDSGYHVALNERQLTDFQLNYMIGYRHLYHPTVQRALLREQARRDFMAFGVPVLVAVSVKIVATVAYFGFAD